MVNSHFDLVYGETVLPILATSMPAKVARTGSGVVSAAAASTTENVFGKVISTGKIRQPQVPVKPKRSQEEEKKHLDKEAEYAALPNNLLKKRKKKTLRKGG